MSQSANAAEDLSAERQEHRYVVAPERGQELVAALAGRLQHHRFRGSAANTLPRPRHFVTTVYFDTPSRHAYRALHGSQPGEHHAKLRAREYYDLHPSLAELATHARDVVRRSPGVWVELKFRDGNRTGKRRLLMPRRYVPDLLSRPASRGTAVAEPPPPPVPADGDDPFAPDAQTPAPTPVWDEAVMREIRTFCAHYPEPLRADCLVHYRRLPWQDPEGALRVTLDVGVEFFAPPPDVWRGDQALVREALGTPKRRFERAIIELKCRTAPPSWLIDLLAKIRAEPSRVSKFEEASQAVHGVAD
jgi:hypothetical protein